MILVNIGVIDIGRKSTCCLGTATLGIGRMLACFHCCGTADTAVVFYSFVPIYGE